MPEVNYTLFRIELDSIPTFGGENSGINLFVNTCERICTKYINNPEVKDLIFQTILSKLRDRAKTLICSRNELRTWALVKDAIYSYFGDKRDFGQLVQEFGNTRMLSKEDPISFGHRLQDLLSQLMTKLAQTDEVQHKAERAEIYLQTALEVYLLNLPEDIQVHVKPLHPRSLEEAIGQVQDAVNFKTRSIAIKNTKIPAPIQQSKITQPIRQQFVPQNYRPMQNSQYQNYNRPFANPNYTYVQPTSPFPRGPVPIFPKPIADQQRSIIPVNKPATVTQRNVWAPGQNKTFSSPKPTPMSGVSTIVTKPNYGQPGRSFKQQPRIPEEFHNTEVEENYTTPQPIYNEDDGLWYIPMEPTQQQEELAYISQEQEEENFTIPASQESSID